MAKANEKHTNETHILRIGINDGIVSRAADDFRLCLYVADALPM